MSLLLWYYRNYSTYAALRGDILTPRETQTLTIFLIFFKESINIIRFIFYITLGTPLAIAINFFAWKYPSYKIFQHQLI